MPKYTPLAFEINPSPEGVVFDVGSLFEALCTLHDQRDARGLRYRLVTVLVFLILAKLAGENQLRGIAQWVRLRAVLLASFLALSKVQAPHATTYSRILNQAVKIEDLEKVSREFFAQQPKAGTSVQITLDGKTMRGTIPAGQSHGVHLLAAYLPDEGWVMFQVEVGRKENEIPAARRIVKALDLRGKITLAPAQGAGAVQVSPAMPSWLNASCPSTSCRGAGTMSGSSRTISRKRGKILSGSLHPNRW